MVGGWSHIGAAMTAAFLASIVEFVEALTVILAVGSTRGWRGALSGAGAALAVLLALVAVLGPALTLMPLHLLQIVVGTLLLLFGMRWLRKAILRAAGLKAKHDEDAPHEKWLVVDATTGSNALMQAREFHQSIGLSGLIMTKLDGSGKGGVAVAIQHELGIPTRFIGTGEKPGDFAAFHRESFVSRIL